MSPEQRGLFWALKMVIGHVYNLLSSIGTCKSELLIMKLMDWVETVICYSAMPDNMFKG